MGRQRLTLMESLGAFWNYRVLLSPQIRFLQDILNYHIGKTRSANIVQDRIPVPSGVTKAEAKPIPTIRFRVFRAKAKIWEPTVEGKALLEENPDMPIETPDGPLRKATHLTPLPVRKKTPTGSPRGNVKQTAKGGTD